MGDKIVIPKVKPINDLGDLIRILDLIKKAVSSDLLVQYWKPDLRFSTKHDVMELGEEGTYPDYIEMYFRSNETGKSYKLEVETYHGSGGEWVEIDD